MSVLAARGSTWLGAALDQQRRQPALNDRIVGADQLKMANDDAGAVFAVAMS